MEVPTMGGSTVYINTYKYIINGEKAKNQNE